MSSLIYFIVSVSHTLKKKKSNIIILNDTTLKKSKCTQYPVTTTNTVSRDKKQIFPF